MLSPFNSKIKISFLLILPIVFVTQIGYSQVQPLDNKFISLYENVFGPEDEKVDETINNYFRGLDLIDSVDDTLAYNFLKSYHWFFRWNNFREESFKTANKTFKLAQNFQDYHYLTSITQHVADYYVDKKEIDSALTFNRKLISFYESKYPKDYSIESKDTYGYESALLSSYNNIGLLYYNSLGRIDSALYYFEKAKRLPEPYQNKDFQFILHSIYDNVGKIYLEQSRNKDAASLFEKNFNYYKIIGEKERWIRAGLQWANSEIEEKGFTASEKMLLDLRQKMDSLGAYTDKSNNEILFATTMESFYSRYNSKEEAVTFSNRLVTLLNEEIEQSKVNQKKQLRTLDKFSNIGMDRAANQFNREKNLRKRESQIRQTITILLIFTLLIAITIVYLLYSRNKLRVQKIEAEKITKEERARVAEMENKLLQKEMQYQEKDLSLFAGVISENQKWGNYLLDKIKAIKSGTVEGDKRLLFELESEIKQRVNIEKNNLNFQNRIDELNSKFFDNLLEAYPKLSKTELKLCSLIRLNLDNHDIALIQNISLDSVYKSRTRLRKKLLIPPKEDIHIFLKKF